MKKTISWMIDEIKKNNDNIIFLYRWLIDSSYTGESSEILCKYLYERIDDLQLHIPTVLRAGIDGNPKSNKGWKYLDYRDDRRNGHPRAPKPDEKLERDGTHLREENYLAMEIFRQGRIEDGDHCPSRIEKIGYVLDYEMPIGGNAALLKANDKTIYNREADGSKYAIMDPYKEKTEGKDNLFNPGKCDLIAYDNNCFTIFELKTGNNTEPLIRAVMEAFTYLNMVDTKRATDSYIRHYPFLNISKDKVTWKAAPLLDVKGSQYKEYMIEDSYLRRLMKKIDIEPKWYNAGFSAL